MTKKIWRRRAFRHGFVNGFASPFLVFGRGSVRFSYRDHDTVSDAWREVGKEIADAAEIERTRIGKAAEQETKHFAIN